MKTIYATLECADYWGKWDNPATMKLVAYRTRKNGIPCIRYRWMPSDGTCGLYICKPSTNAAFVFKAAIHRSIGYFHINANPGTVRNVQLTQAGIDLGLML